jgi:transcriptional antiterminator RfaH
MVAGGASRNSRGAQFRLGSQEVGSTLASENSSWYVIRTKQYKERFVQQRLLFFVEDSYVPLLRTKRRRLGKLVERTEPLFPCYLFARFALKECHYKVTHAPGVAGFVCVGGEPCAADASIIQGIKSRETNGLITVNEKTLRPRQRVTITQGRFRGIEAVFERYLSGAERVAVLLHSLGCGRMRAILDTSAVEPLQSTDIARDTSTFSQPNPR